MKVNLLLLTSLFCLISTTLLSQKVDLQWKIQKDQQIVYETVNSVLKNEQSGTFDGLFKMINDSTESDSTKNIYSKLEQFAETMLGDRSKFQQLAVLQRRPDNLIDVKIIVDDFSKSKDEPDTTKQTFFSRMSKGIMMRGVINENGGIESFYTKWDQKNMLSLLFELPQEKVKTGDQWTLDVGWIQMDQNFQVDSASRSNLVTLTNIRKVAKEQVATLRYDMSEAVYGNFINPMLNKNIATTLILTFEGIAEFSITEGKWLTFNGVLSYEATGWQNTNYSTAYILKELKDPPSTLDQYK